MKNILNKKDITFCDNIHKQVDELIVSFLSAITAEEYRFLTSIKEDVIFYKRNIDRVNYYWNFYDLAFINARARGGFWTNNPEDYDFLIKLPVKDYIILEYLDTGINVAYVLNDPIFIPYAYTEADNKEIFKKFLQETYEDKGKLKIAIKEHKEKTDKDKKAEEKLYGIHHDGKYSYQYEKCDRCCSGYSSGSITVGTGRYEHQGAYDREGDYIESEVMKQISCPKCSGTGGFIKYSDNNSRYLDMRKPCSLYHFKEHQDCFLDILLK